jgi:hypothetical protein
VKRITPWLAALLLTAAASAQAQAGHFWHGGQPGANAFSPGCIGTNMYAPSYGVGGWGAPPWPPYSGIGPGMPPRSMPTHPFARSPRDFFMLDLY